MPESSRRGGLSLRRDGGRCPRLLNETLLALRVSRQRFGKELQGNLTAELRVFGQVHLAHPALADLLGDAVVGNRGFQS